MRPGQKWTPLDVGVVVTTTSIGLALGIALAVSVDAGPDGDVYFLAFAAPMFGCMVGLGCVDFLMNRRKRPTECTTCGTRLTTPHCPVCGGKSQEPKPTSIEEFLGDG